ncbi:MAG: chemotaxis protein CheW [Bauldia sp.]
MRGQAVDGADPGGTRAAALRAAFDRAFAEPPAPERGAPLDFLSVRLGGDPFAIRLTDTAGLFADRKITPVPTTVAEFRGVSGFRGVLVPVYDLGALLGYAPLQSGRWLVLAAGGALAFVFDAFEGHIRVPPEGVSARRDSGSAHGVHEIARLGDRAWPVIDIPAAVEAIRARLPRSNASKE